MKAAVYYETGGPEVFRYEDVPDPVAGSRDLLVRVEAISIEGGRHPGTCHGRARCGARTSWATSAPGPSWRPATEVEGFSVGDRVVTVGLDGSHAELRAVPTPFCWPVPPGLSIEEAACVPVPFGTADDCLFEFGRLQPGETALIHAGGSGVGIAAVQMASRAGARVLATASSDEKLVATRAVGPRRGDQLRHHRFRRRGAQADRRAGRGRDRRLGGWSDPAGKPAAVWPIGAAASRSATPVARAGEQLDVSTLRPNNQSLTGYFLGAELFLSPRAHAMIARHLDDIAVGLAPGGHRPPFPLSEAAEAHAYIESRKSFGRVLLVP